MNDKTHDPVALAVEVLDMAHEDETITVCTIPDNKVAALARTVLDLTDKVKRMEAFAERLDATARWGVDYPDVDVQAHALADRDLAAQIRAILNGESH